MKFIINNNGIINTKEARGNNIPLKNLQRLAADGQLERIARGLYMHNDYILDPFYLVQYRAPKAIFSHNTALYLHRLSDENPSILTMTVPSGWNSSLIKEVNKYKFYYYKEDIWEIGQEKSESPLGNQIKLYNKERTICDCIQYIDAIGRDIVVKAIKEYVLDLEARNVEKLFRYSEIFNIRDQVRNYVEAFYEI